MRLDNAFEYLTTLPQTTQRVSVRRQCGSADKPVQAVEALELLADEVPVALVYNGISHAVMLASPDDLEDFALGFSLSEQIIDDRFELYDCEVVSHEFGIEIRMNIAAAAMHRLKMSRRARTGKTGCGLCGMESLQQFDRSTNVVACGSSVEAKALERAMIELRASQHLHDATGATHAAGWALFNGTLLIAREDVGRHNALDKLIGGMARQKISVEGGFAVVTSRASYEMVQKAVRAAMPLLAAVSAPTAMAVRMADAAGLTLAGFVRERRYVAYSHAYRIRQ